MNLENYKTFVFDCDGVILNSNPLKTDAFRQLALPYGDAVAKSFVDFHRDNAGASRYRKIEFLLSELLNEEPDADKIRKMSKKFADLIADRLHTCEVASGLDILRATFADASWIVVSGSDQSELRSLFDRRELSQYFSDGVFGSPDTKDTILAREIAAGRIVKPALFIGDSRYDYNAATRAGLSFLFVSDWTEFIDWKTFVRENKIPTIPRLSKLAEYN